LFVEASFFISAYLCYNIFLGAERIVHYAAAHIGGFLWGYMGIFTEKVSSTNIVEVIRGANLTFHEMDIYGQEGTLFDPGDKQNKVKKCEIFLRMQDKLAAILPGSVLMPKDFLLALGSNAPEELLLSEKMTKAGEQPILSHTTNHMQLNVYHGSRNEAGATMSRIAELGFDSALYRAIYQSNLVRVYEPLASKISSAKIELDDDCLASGDSIAGFLGIISKLGKRHFDGEIVRVDVAVATTQGVLILEQLAKDNNFFLELNVGYLAYALTKGEYVDGKIQHANYITQPDELVNKYGMSRVVVGDMGEAVKSFEKALNGVYPWNQWRNDLHGDTPNERRFNDVDWENDIQFILTNGGLGVESIYRFHGRDYSNLVPFVAKRIHGEHGYGLAVTGISNEIRKNLVC
jgi:hypothetical protein